MVKEEHTNLRYFVHISTLLLIICSQGELKAGWSEDVRLTNRRYEIHPQVIARNDTVHVAWQQIAGPMHISYMRSTDGGNEWDSLVNLEETGHYGAFPDFSLFPGGMFVGWFDDDTSNAATYIAYSGSSDGSIWSSPENVSHSIIRMYDLGTAAFQDSIYAVYFSRQFDSTRTHPLRFLYSSDRGTSWSNEATVGYVSEYTNFLHMAHCRNSLYVVWASDLAPLGFYREVMASVSHDGGVSWSEVTQLSSPDTAAAQHTCIACDEESGNFAVGWMDYGLSGSFPGDLFVRITTDGGYNWMPESHATAHHGVWGSSLTIVGDSLWAVWTDVNYPEYGNGNEEICFSKSTDLGTNWSPYERLTYNPEHSMSPWIAYDHGKLHVVWYNDNAPPDSGMDIYYKRYDPEPDAIDDAPAPLPQAASLFTYPNPFNSSIIITYSNLKGGEIDIFDIKGQLLSTFFTGGENEGRIKWDATDAEGNKVSSGVYFARVETPQTSKTLKLVLLR
jgi:hypothetical protein